jgi:predicted SAM-dependent methyltransferase
MVALMKLINIIIYVKSRFKLKKEDVNSKKLHLGCGAIHIPGYCNVDIDYLTTVDKLDDVKKLKKFPNGYAELIYACHILEHLSHTEVIPTLKRWYDVLQPGGELRISVPDIDRIVKIYINNWDHFQTPGNSPWIGLIYGGQITSYDYHKTGFNFCFLSYLLENVGFEDIMEYPNEPHFIPGIVDASMGMEPFGEYFSLNVKANKPKISPVKEN